MPRRRYCLGERAPPRASTAKFAPLPSLAATPHAQKHLLALRQVHHVRRLRERLGDVLGGVDAPHLDEAPAVLCERLRDHLGSLGLALGSDHGCLPLLLGALHDELLPLGILLCNLLLLDSVGELLPVGEVHYGHVVHENAELARALHDGLPDLSRDLLAVREELLGVVLCDRRLEDLVGHRREHALVVVGPQRLVDVGQPGDFRLEEHADVHCDGLQVLGARGGLDQLGA
mmetsp:Transcript_22634/g.51713  ORF Transcript_22634/g.51713 Transcript_22634/m.51713 type:complete len:231 (+) Transcript_22634:20-712(+)